MKATVEDAICFVRHYCRMIEIKVSGFPEGQPVFPTVRLIFILVEFDKHLAFR